jgi:hypothetical protein
MTDGTGPDTIYNLLVELGDYLRSQGDERYADLITSNEGLIDRANQLAAHIPDLTELPPELADAIRPLAEAFGSQQPQSVAIHPTKSPEDHPFSWLSAKDVLLLLLVALLLLRGGEGHPTALGEAIESNDLQVVGIVIALAAYLRKGE